MLLLYKELIISTTTNKTHKMRMIGEKAFLSQKNRFHGNYFSDRRQKTFMREERPL